MQLRVKKKIHSKFSCKLVCYLLQQVPLTLASMPKLTSWCCRDKKTGLEKDLYSSWELGMVHFVLMNLCSSLPGSFWLAGQLPTALLPLRQEYLWHLWPFRATWSFKVNDIVNDVTNRWMTCQVTAPWCTLQVFVWIFWCLLWTYECVRSNVFWKIKFSAGEGCDVKSLCRKDQDLNRDKLGAERLEVKVWVIYLPVL